MIRVRIHASPVVKARLESLLRTYPQFQLIDEERAEADSDPLHPDSDSRDDDSTAEHDPPADVILTKLDPPPLAGRNAGPNTPEASSAGDRSLRAAQAGFNSDSIGKTASGRRSFSSDIHAGLTSGPFAPFASAGSLAEAPEVSFSQPTPVVLLVRDPVEALPDALRRGVRAVLSSSANAAQIAVAIEAAAAGLFVFDAEDIEQLLPPRALDHSDEPLLEPLLEPITPRELEVLRALAEGLANKEIAARLGISENTVKFHVGSVMGKLGASSRTEAVTLGIRRALILL